MAKPFAADGWVIDDGRAFKGGSDIFRHFRFPFTPVDPTPGGSNLGRMEWCLEILPGLKEKGHLPIVGVALWARQTRDPRYTGRIFHLPMCTDQLAGIGIGEPKRSSFFAGVWHVFMCSDHRNIVLGAYCPAESSALIVETSSGIGNIIYFE